MYNNGLLDELNFAAFVYALGLKNMWLDKFLDYRKTILIGFGILSVASFAALFTLKFSFSFEQFFPKGDKDLEFFNEFIEEFETDDNFLLIAVQNEPDIFQTDFLQELEKFKEECAKLPHVVSAQAITDISIPQLSLFGIKNKPLLNKENQADLDKSKQSILEDERLVYNIINSSGNSTIVHLKTAESIQVDESVELMEKLKLLLNDYDFQNHHLLGRAYFQDELSAMQKREVLVSSLVSIILVCIILFLIYRKPITILIALVSIGLGLLIFMGLLGVLGRELNAMSAFYPVLMLIVGTSDIIHIMTKYLDELKSGKVKQRAIKITIREIGLATLLTSLTTAAGFFSLVTSKVEPVRDFGINSAIGVLVAYFTVIFFSTLVLSYFNTDQLITKNKQTTRVDNLSSWLYKASLKHFWVKISLVLFAVFAVFGFSKITTNYKIESNLPRGEKITEDFFYFEKEFGGFRPFEFAVIAQDNYKADDFEVIKELDKLENYLKESGYIKTIISPATIYKSVNEVLSFGEKYELPQDTASFNQVTELLNQIKLPGTSILFNKDRTKTRISSRINDYGAESIKSFGREIDDWIEMELDSQVVEVKRTGTGLLLDKNSEYIRDSLLYGLGLASILVSVLMGLLFRDPKMIIISIITNVLPLIFAAAVIGYIGIELEAGISIVFAIVFGIAVDDTIHFLSKYKLCRLKKLSKEDSIKLTFKETGKAIIITSVILFFGFLIMLISVHPPSITIGLLISITLVSAIVADLLVLPMLLRLFAN